MFLLSLVVCVVIAPLFVSAVDLLTAVCGVVAPFSGFPKLACIKNCESCIKEGGVFCDAGRFVIEPELFTSNTTGVCWPGTIGGPTDTDVKVTFPPLSITFKCDDVAGLPRFGQCNVPGYAPFVAAAVLVGVVLSLCMSLCFFCQRRRQRTARY
jgi:hypothetical protein